MKQFMVGPGPDNKVINLKQVSNIGFEFYIDRNGEDTWKIIINFGYGVSLKNDFSKEISDYQYFVFHDKEQYDDYVTDLTDLINDSNWLAPKVNGEVKRIINPDLISFIATDKRKNRIILNLAASVSFYKTNQRKTSDFLFIDFDTEEEFKSEYQYMRSQLVQEM